MTDARQQLINLYFRQAFKLWNETEQAETSFELYLKALKKRMSTAKITWEQDREAQIYWDVLWLVNCRGKSLKDLTQQEDSNDPEKDEYIRNMIENKTFARKIFMDYGEKK